MASSQMSPRFVIFVVVSLLTHLMDVAATGLFCHLLMQQDQLKTPWFSISAGLLIIPLVGLQLISAVYLLRRKGETSTTMEVTLTAVLHVLQLGFISRHFAILQESSIPSKKYEIAEMLVLRLVFSITSGCPLLLIKLYVLFEDSHESSWDWAIYLTMATALLAITWALATFRRSLSGLAIDALLITCPGTFLKIVWRAGEITTRMIALSLFTSLYTYWLFLVIGLHWFAMFVCVCVPAITPFDLHSKSFLLRAFYSIVASFTYVFVFINTTCENTIFRYTFYYIIFFLENTTLVTVWLVQVPSNDRENHEAFVYIAALSFLASIISMTIYYKFFHTASPKENPTTACGNSSCLSCKLNIAANNPPPIPPRPGVSDHWLSQYHTALYCGQYCKHNVQDSLLDSTSDRNSVLTVSSSHARLQQKLATINDGMDGHNVACKTTKARDMNHPNSSTSEQQSVTPRSKPRRKNKKKIDSGKKVSSKKGGNTSEDSGSQKQPVWLPSGDSNFANQLLTYSLETFDTNDTADDERSSVATGVQDVRFRRDISPKEIPSVRKQIENGSWSPRKHGEDRHWYSDGYSTDRTLDWQNFPVTSLQRNIYNSSLDTDDDHINCCQCSHGDSEVSSIMRSIEDVPEPSPSGRRSREISPRDRNGKDYRKQPHQHAHHDHHCHIHTHRQHRNADSKTKVSQAFSPNDSDKLDKRDGKSTMSSNHRTPELSSPASDPSHGPKPKRKLSPKRRFHGAANLGPLPSNLNPTAHQRPMPPSLCGTKTNLSQSDKMAADLLAKSSKRSKSKERGSSNSGIVSDPRFNVRVMVSQNSESFSNKHRDECELDKDASPDKRMDEDNSKPFNQNSEKKQILGVTVLDSDVDLYKPSVESDVDLYKPSVESDVDLYKPSVESDVDLYKPSVDTEEESNVLPYSSSSAIDSKEKPNNQSTNNQSNQSKGVGSLSDRDPLSQSSEGTTDEAIYENIWQVKRHDEIISTKSKLGKKNRAFVEDEPSKFVPSSTKIRDAWFMCSESEDSALPTEILSSSVDGFTASENGSDVSVEIVI